MSARDELFDIARSVIDGELGILVNGSDIDNTADSLSYAILAAGYSKPRTITAVEELDALGLMATVLDANGTAWVNDGETEDPWASVAESSIGGPVWTSSPHIPLPATILHEGATK